MFKNKWFSKTTHPKPFKKRVAPATHEPLRGSPQKGHRKKISFFYQLLQSINKKRKHVNKANLTERAVEFLLTRSDKDLRSLKINDVAAAISISPGKISRSFKKDMRTTFAGYVEREIIVCALCYLEKNKRIAIRTLSKKLGFSKVTDFEEIFEGYLLVKPGKYKEFIKERNNKSLKAEHDDPLKRNIETLRN